MRNSILSILTVTALMACNKNETKTMDTTGDSTVVMPNDSAASNTDTATMPTDSTATGNSTSSNLNDQDKKFADAAAKGGMMEVMMGQLAALNASQAAVKSLGAMMVKDHSKANGELKQWANAAGYKLPTTMDADQQKKYDDLKTKKEPILTTPTPI